MSNVSLKDKVVLCFDFGSQISVATRLSRDFGRVLYYIPSVINGFEDHKAHDIGRGVEGIERVHDWWDYYDEIDLFVFTDIYMGGLQEFLRRQGKRVFGSGKAGLLETNRLEFKKLVAELGLPINKYDTAIGVNELEEKLKKVEDKFIKASLRGDCETFHHINYTLSKEELKRMKHDLGVFDSEETYIIEDPIEAIGEIGFDGYTVNGNLVDNSCSGIELKDCAYIGKIISNDKLPKQIREVNDAFAPVLASYGYCGAWSTEIRVDKKGVGYFIDTTNRFPEPNTALTLEMYDNYSEIIWMIAGGEMPTIKASEKWGVQLIVKSELAKTMPVAIQFPKKYEKFIKIKNLIVDNDGTHWYSPNNIEMCEIAAVVATGTSLKSAIEKVKEIASSIKGHDLKIKMEALEEATEEIADLKKNNINFL